MSWQLLLTTGAKRLITVFIVLGVLFGVGESVLQSTQTKNQVNVAVASNQLEQSYNTLNTQLTSWKNTVQTCGSSLSCFT